jgi:hypothetical protein
MNTEIHLWAIDKLVPYPHNPRKNDPAIDRMCSSIREFAFKIPCLVRSDGEVIDGHLRLKAARQMQLDQVPVILCDEWSPAQVKAFRLLVNRSATWADWDEQLVAMELSELSALDFDLGLTGFDVQEINDFLFQDPTEDLGCRSPATGPIRNFRWRPVALRPSPCHLWRRNRPAGRLPITR